MISSQGSLWLKSHPSSPSLPSLYSTLHFEIKNNRLLNKMVHFTIDKNYTPCNILILWFFAFSPIKWQFLSTYLILTKIKIKKKKKKKNIKARWLISSMYSFFFFFFKGGEGAASGSPVRSPTRLLPVPLAFLTLPPMYSYYVLLNKWFLPSGISAHLHCRIYRHHKESTWALELIQKYGQKERLC